MLISKLRSLGIGGNIFVLLKSYLSQRKQYVQTSGAKSTLRNVTSGVPQRSILGPLLFLLYIIDLPECMSDMDSFGYADDFKVLVTNQVAMNKATDNIQALLNTFMMLPNTKKSYTLNIKGNLEAQLCNAKLTPVQSQRDLELIVQQNLSWNENCKRRSNKAMGALFQTKRNLTSTGNRRIKLNAYTAQLLSIANILCPNCCICFSDLVAK